MRDRRPSVGFRQNLRGTVPDGPTRARRWHVGMQPLRPSAGLSRRREETHVHRCRMSRVRAGRRSRRRRTRLTTAQAGSGPPVGLRGRRELRRQPADRRPIPDQAPAAVRAGHGGRRADRRMRRRRGVGSRSATGCSPTSASAASPRRRSPGRRSSSRSPTASVTGRPPRSCRATSPGGTRCANEPVSRAGDTLLVLGGGSGVGLAAVDIGAALGLRVIAAASTAEKRDLAMSKGCAGDDRQLDTRRGRRQGCSQGVRRLLRGSCGPWRRRPPLRSDRRRVGRGLRSGRSARMGNIS